MTITPLTTEQLDEIQARADVATDGPWERYEKYGPDFFACTIGSYLRGVGTFTFGDGTDAAADEEFVKHAVQDVRALVAEVRRLHAAMEQNRHLHKDSPMGPCPVCIDADAAAAGGDGLVPYPCPTARLAGAKDCDPPHVRAARYEAAGNAMAASLCRDGFGDEEIANMLGPGVTDGEAPEPVLLRWGLDDVMWGDDDSVTVILSGPAGEPYWLELDPERAAALRENLAGPDSEDSAAEERPADGFTEARAAFMQIGRTPSLEGLRAELHIEGQPTIVGRYAGASMGRMHDVPGHEHLLAVDPRLIFEYAAEEPPAEACAKCRQPFDPTDTRFDGAARHRETPYCRSCVDRCHDTEIADHRCVICQ